MVKKKTKGMNLMPLNNRVKGKEGGERTRTVQPCEKTLYFHAALTTAYILIIKNRRKNGKPKRERKSPASSSSSLEATDTTRKTSINGAKNPFLKNLEPLALELALGRTPCSLETGL